MIFLLSIRNVFSLSPVVVLRMRASISATAASSAFPFSAGVSTPRSIFGHRGPLHERRLHHTGSARMQRPDILFLMAVSLSSLVPNAEDLLALEVEQGAGVLLAHLRSFWRL